MWKDHFKLMADGNLPLQKKMYTAGQTGGQDVNLISPTEAVIEQARSDLKRTLSDMPLYKPKKVKLTVQSGGGQSSGKKRKKKKTKKNSSKLSGRKGKSTSKKKKSKAKRKSGKKSKKVVKKKAKRSHKQVRKARKLKIIKIDNPIKNNKPKKAKTAKTADTGAEEEERKLLELPSVDQFLSKQIKINARRNRRKRRYY